MPRRAFFPLSGRPPWPLLVVRRADPGRPALTVGPWDPQAAGPSLRGGTGILSGHCRGRRAIRPESGPPSAGGRRIPSEDAPDSNAAACPTCQCQWPESAAMRCAAPHLMKAPRFQYLRDPQAAGAEGGARPIIIPTERIGGHFRRSTVGL